jgi:hypothetical protein
MGDAKTKKTECGSRIGYTAGDGIPDRMDKPRNIHPFLRDSTQDLYEVKLAHSV